MVPSHVMRTLSGGWGDKYLIDSILSLSVFSTPPLLFTGIRPHPSHYPCPLRTYAQFKRPLPASGCIMLHHASFFVAPRAGGV